jgi:hypothetical protein
MSDYRFEIVDHHGIRSLHVMIDSEPMAETYIPIEDISKAIIMREINERPRVQVTQYETSPLTGQVIHKILDEDEPQ